MLDDTDRRILRHYQHDSSLPVAELAEMAGVTQATCARRIERMRETGVIGLYL